MSYTGTELFNIAVAVIDELSDSGTVDETQIAEYKYRAPYLLDIWQREAAKILKTFTIARHPQNNLLGGRFDTVEHIDEDRTYETAEAAKAAVFSVEGDAEVFIEEYISGAWSGVSGYYSQDGGDEEAFTGLISVSGLTAPSVFKCRFSGTGEKVRFRFSGDYYYLFYNFALFKAAVASCAKVPDYSQYVFYSTPDDFLSEREIAEETPEAGISHRWENEKDLYINYDFDGVLKVTYKASPAKITALTQTVEADDETAMSAVYYLAQHFALSDQNDTLAAVCKSKFAELKSENTKERPLAGSVIRDVYGISDIR